MKANGRMLEEMAGRMLEEIGESRLALQFKHRRVRESIRFASWKALDGGDDARTAQCAV